MTSTLSGQINQNMTLTAAGAYTSPFTIAQTGTVSGAVYSALSGSATPLLENLGLAGSVKFQDGGTVINASTISNQGLGDGILMPYGDGIITNSDPNSVIYGGNYGIAILQGVGNITNAGSIRGLAGAAVEIATGNISNDAGAAIYAHEFGMKILSNGGTIDNAGSITGNQYGIFMNGGTATNAGPGAIIAGELGGLFDFSADATIFNSGTIMQNGAPFGTGVKLFGGTLVNTGFIYGATGIYVANAGTIFDAGTISAMRDAINFSSTQGSRLIIAPGAGFNGDVIANPAATNTMEFSAGRATLNGIGDIFSGFNTIVFDPSAIWQLNGSFGNESISGFTTADTLDLTNLSISSTVDLTLSAGDVLTIPQSPTLTITFSAANANELFELAPDGHNGALLTALTTAPPSHAVTLQSSPPSVTIATPIDTFGVIGTYDIQTTDGIVAEIIGAALFDPVSASLTISNTSLIQSDSSTYYSSGVVLGASSSFFNAGTVIGASGISDFAVAPGAYILSSNQIMATLGTGIYLQQSGSALNTGRLSAASIGMLLGSGGYAYNSGDIIADTGISAKGAPSYVYNAGRITGSENGITLLAPGTAFSTGIINVDDTGIFLAGGAAYNYGSISAATGILLSGGGYVYAAGYISATTGISVTGGGTIVEYGTLIGLNYAAYFEADASNRIIINSSSRIQGMVSGGDGVLELASNHARGTIALSQFENFNRIEVDEKAHWDVTSSFITNSALLNNGILRLSRTSDANLDGAISGAGTIILSAGLMEIGGGVAASQKIAFSGSQQTLALTDPTAFDGSIHGFKIGDTIDLDGQSIASINGTAFVNHVLTISERGLPVTLTFASADNFSGDVFVLTQNDASEAITLQRSSRMMLLKRSAKSASVSLPQLPAPTIVHSVASYIDPTIGHGFLNTLLTQPSASPLIITLQS